MAARSSRLSGSKEEACRAALRLACINSSFVVATADGAPAPLSLREFAAKLRDATLALPNDTYVFGEVSSTALAREVPRLSSLWRELNEQRETLQIDRESVPVVQLAFGGAGSGLVYDGVSLRLGRASCDARPMPRRRRFNTGLALLLLLSAVLGGSCTHE